MTPDRAQQQVRELIRELASADAGGLPLLSIYLDTRPEGIGESPGRRDSIDVVLRDRLREIRRTFQPQRGPAIESYDTDVAKIEAFIADELEPSTEGLAIFACSAAGIWHAFQAGVPFEDHVSVGGAADLYQLARFADDYETAVVAIVDTNSSRLFVQRQGHLRERGGPDDDPESYRRTDVGGWSQARYQRHIDKHRREFTEEIGAAITQLCEREGAQHVIIAGAEPGLTLVLDQLPADVRQRVDRVIRMDMRADVREVAQEVEPLLRAIEAESEAALVERVIAEVRRGGLGTSGAFAVRKALERGQVDVVVLEDGGAVETSEREEIVRQAAATGATVEVVADSEALRELGGVAALLRYRI